MRSPTRVAVVGKFAVVIVKLFSLRQCMHNGGLLTPLSHNAYRFWSITARFRLFALVGHMSLATQSRFWLSLYACMMWLWKVKNCCMQRSQPFRLKMSKNLAQNE